MLVEWEAATVASPLVAVAFDLPRTSFNRIVNAPNENVPP